MMHQSFNQFAEALVFVHGKRVEAEAALHSALCEKSGDSETAATWREVQHAVRDYTLRKSCEVTDSKLNS